MQTKRYRKLSAPSITQFYPKLLFDTAPLYVIVIALRFSIFANYFGHHEMFVGRLFVIWLRLAPVYAVLELIKIVGLMKALVFDQLKYLTSDLRDRKLRHADLQIRLLLMKRVLHIKKRYEFKKRLANDKMSFVHSITKKVMKIYF